MATEHQLRQEIIRFSHLCYERHLLVAMDGNLSVRLNSGEILCTKAGCHKGFLTDDDLVIVDRKGAKVRGNGKPTSEMSMHLACYDERPDVAAIIHTHPPISIAFTIAGVSMARCVLPEVVLTLGTVPTVAYATTGTQDLADAIRAYIKSYDAILMDRHGAVTVGTSLLEAFCRLETMEHTALITKTARDLGAVRELPPDEAQRLRSMGLKRYGGPPAAVEKADAPGADLPPACLSCSGCNRPDPHGLAPRSDLRFARASTRPLASLMDAIAEAKQALDAPRPAPIPSELPQRNFFARHANSGHQQAPEAPAAKSGGEREVLTGVGEAPSPTKNKHSAGLDTLPDSVAGDARAMSDALESAVATEVLRLLAQRS